MALIGILIVTGGIIILWCIKGVIEIFIEDYKYCARIENENYQRGRGMDELELEDEIKILKNTKVKPGWKLETASKRRGMEKALREKLKNKNAA